MDAWAEKDGQRCESCAKCNPNPKSNAKTTAAATPASNARQCVGEYDVLTASWQSELGAFDDGLV
jgi:hypothetical protein